MSQWGDKAALLSVLEYLRVLADGAPDETAKTQLSVAHDMLVETFGIQPNDPETFRQHSYFPLLLPAIFQAGVRALGAQPFAEAVASVEGNPTFQTYLKNVTSKAYFQGTTEGSIEYLQRYAKVVQKFKEKLAAAEAKPAQNAAAPAATAAAKETKPAATSPTAGASSDNEAQAEAKKNEGNDALRGGDYQTALRLYGEAIQLSPAGPQSHIYYCNRAAAHCYLENYSAAVSDCNKAISLKPDYSKAYSRLGFAHFHTANYEEAEKALKKAVELDPSNKQAKDLLKQTQDKMQQQRRGASGAPGAAGGQQMPDLSSLAGMLGGLGGGPGGAGGAGGLASLLQNPAMMQMAQQVMSNPAMMQQVMGALGGGAGGSGGGGGLASLLQNPAMMQMAQQAMQDPQMMASLAGMMGGAGAAAGTGGAGGAGGAGGSPFSPDLLQQLQSDPRVAAMRANPAYSGFFSAIERGDITSAIQAAQDDPELMQAIQGLLRG